LSDDNAKASAIRAIKTHVKTAGNKALFALIFFACDGVKVLFLGFVTLGTNRKSHIL